MTLEAVSVPTSPFCQLDSFSRAELAAAREVAAAERRLLTAHFVECFHWEALRPQLPFRLEFPTEGRPWCTRVCRSYYTWSPPDDIQSPADLAGLDNFGLALCLFDFSAWQPILGQRFASALGPPPFDPVSLGLAWLLARWREWDWPQLLT